MIAKTTTCQKSLLNLCRTRQSIKISRCKFKTMETKRKIKLLSLASLKRCRLRSQWNHITPNTTARATIPTLTIRMNRWQTFSSRWKIRNLLKKARWETRVYPQSNKPNWSFLKQNRQNRLPQNREAF